MALPRIPDNAFHPTDRRVMAALALLLAAVYVLAGRFRLYTIDEVATFATTRSLVQHGAFPVDILAWALPISGANSVVATGVDGHIYSIKDIAPSILLTPLAFMAYHLGVSALRAVYVLPIVVTALCGALLFQVVREHGYRQRVALAAGLAYGLATMALPYARTLFTQPLTALGLLVALWGVAASRRTGRGLPALIGGLGLGLAGLSSAPVLATLPIYPLALVRRPAGDEGVWAAAWRRLARPVIPFALGAGLMMGTQGLFNWLRFGSPLATGHTQVGASLQLTYLGLGLWGQLISAPRGILWYVPMTLLIPASLAIANRRSDPLALLRLCLAQSLIVWVVYSAYFYWWGGANFGPRFLVPAMPALTLLIVPVLDRILRPDARVWQRLSVAVIMLVSFATQAAGSLLDTSSMDGQIGAALDKVTPPPRFFAMTAELTDPAYLPQSLLWNGFRQGRWDTLWMSSGQLDVPLLGAELALVALAGATLALAARGAPTRIGGRGLAFQAAATLAVVVFAIGRYPRTPGYYAVGLQPLDTGIEAVNQFLHTHASAADGVIVMLYPEQMLTWLESPQAVPSDIGLTLENPLRPVNRALLSNAAQWYARLWVASRWSYQSDPANGVEQWLSEHAYVGAEVKIKDFRIIPYLAGPDAGTLDERETSFGSGAIMLRGASVSLRREGLAVWLHWEAQRAPKEDYTAFVHIINAGGSLVGQQDGWPLGGFAPTSHWRPGQVIDDRRAVLLPATLPAGDYIVRIGLYATASGKPLLVDETGAPDVTLATLRLGR